MQPRLLSLREEVWPADEEWRAIAGYDGWYEVSNWGRVRSWRIRGAPGRRRSEPLLRRCVTFGYGKVLVNLSRDGGASGRLVHRLVAEAFIGPIPDDKVVCHGDGDATNNRVENLRIDTRSANEADKVAHGTSPRGERNHRAKLTEAEVIEIRQRRKSGEPAFRLATAYQTSAQNVTSICTRRSWKHVA